MSEMVERVARAIALNEPGVNHGRPPRWPSDYSEREATGHRLQARAAITAMRDPTEEMEKVGFAKTRIVMGDFCHAADCPLGAVTPGGVFRRVWHAMIDAADSRRIGATNSKQPTSD